MITEIPINQGAYKTKNQSGVRNSGYAQDFINMFIDSAGTNYDRPTLELFATLPSVEPIGMTFFKGLLIVVTLDRNIFSIDSLGAVTNITSVSLPGTARPIFASSGDYLFIVGGGNPISWQGPGYQTQTLGGSPPDMTHIVYLDGFLLGNRRLDSENNKVIEFCDFEDFDSWSGTNIFSAVSAPDPVSGLAVSQRELYVVGEETTEIWQNVGTSPVPFARAHIWQYGTKAKYSILSADNSIFFIDQDRRFLRFSGREFVRISEAVEEEFSGFSIIDDCVASSFTFNGSIHIKLIFPTAGKTWSVDLRNNQWTEWRGFREGWVRPRINCSVYGDGETYAGDFTTGKIWKFSETNKTDAGGIFVRERTFCQRDAGAGIKKNARLIRFNLKRDIASSYTGSTPQTNPTLEMRFKDDNKPWSNFRQFSLGEKGNYKTYAEFYRLGIYKTRSYQFRFSDPSALSIVSVETDEEVMNS